MNAAMQDLPREVDPCAGVAEKGEGAGGTDLHPGSLHYLEGGIGQPVQLVPSRAPNPKVTLPEDLPLIEAWIDAAEPKPPTARGG